MKKDDGLAAGDGFASPRDAAARDFPAAADIVDLLTERRKLRYAGDCKCGKCCLVPHEMLCSAIDEIKRLRGAQSVSTSWAEKIAAERARIGRPLTLDELVGMAKAHQMTDAEIAAQRQSWTRQDMD